MDSGKPSDAKGELSKLKRCYQSARQLLKESSDQEVILLRDDFACLASTVLAELGDVSKTLMECMQKKKVGDSVLVPRSAMIPLMKAVAGWLSTHLRAGPTSEPLVATPDTSQQVLKEQPAAANWQGRVLVVGAGATGSCAALRLRASLGSKARIVVSEKARGAGGRMSTNRQDSINVRADMGAPYLSLDGNDTHCSAVADMLLKARVCSAVSCDRLSKTPERPSQTEWMHLAGVDGGVNDALKKILSEARAEVFYDRRVASLDQQRGKWRAKPFKGSVEDFDAVIVAVPGCGVGGDNLNKINGGWENLFSREQNQKLQGVQHDQRWALALFFPFDCAAKCDTFFGPRAVEKLVDDGIVHLLCYQSRKTAQINGAASKGGLAIVAHSTLEWARRNSRANGRDQRLLDEVSEQVKRILGLGRVRLLASKVITWKQCHVTRPIQSDHTNGPCMLVNSNPPLALAGDYFTESNFGGCLKSAYAAADSLAKGLAAGTDEPPAKRKRN